MCHPGVPIGTRMPEVRTEAVAIPVTDGRMPALLALPERTPAPAVLLINDVFGQQPFYEHLSRRLAVAGYVALDPEYFWRQGPLPEQTREAAMARREKLDDHSALRDLSSAIDWVKRRPEVRDGRVGTVGFCMGGTYVLMLAAERDDLRASVSYYGFPTTRTPERSPIDVADRMRGPILGHWGDQDTGVGVENVEELRRRLREAKVEHTFHIYPGLGHGFLKAFLEDEGAPGYAQACESWKRTLDFCRRELA